MVFSCNLFVEQNVTALRALAGVVRQERLRRRESVARRVVKSNVRWRTFGCRLRLSFFVIFHSFAAISQEWAVEAQRGSDGNRR